MAQINSGAVDVSTSDSETDCDQGIPLGTALSVNRPPSKRKRAYSYKYCDHCHQNVSKTSYYRHKALMLADAEKLPDAGTVNVPDFSYFLNYSESAGATLTT